MGIIPTSLDQVLRTGETVVWSGRPKPQVAPRLNGFFNTVLPLLMSGYFVWFSAQNGAPLLGVAMVAALLAVIAGQALAGRRKLARTTYYLTDRRAICADGKTVTTIALAASPFLVYSAGGHRVTATFGTQMPPDRWAWLKPPVSTELVFSNITDVEGLVAALDHVAHTVEPKQLRMDWATYEADGSAAASSEHLPEVPPA